MRVEALKIIMGAFLLPPSVQDALLPHASLADPAIVDELLCADHKLLKENTPPGEIPAPFSSRDVNGAPSGITCAWFQVLEEHVECDSRF